MIYNFSSGPSILPQEVFKKAAEAILDFEDTGLSILEISHRTPQFEGVLEEAVHLVKELLDVPTGYSVLFLQGGASMQFSMVPANLLAQGQTAAYLDTGIWASKAINEAILYGKVAVVASSAKDKYAYIPKEYTLPEKCSYLHYTSNNTIYGTELFACPQVNVPVVCDMSSDIFSYKIDVSHYGLIYAGAQKNVGPAGTTLVIIKDELIEHPCRKLPSMLDYRKHRDNQSMYNTPPVFSIYVSLLNLRWLKRNGGVEAMETLNISKAKLLYDEIDRNALFKGTCAVNDRSRMNVCFTAVKEKHQELFLNYAEQHNISGIKGHRLAGGFRAAIYNAMSLEGVQHLVHIMRNFESIYG